MAYLQDEVTLRLTYLRGKCCVSPIRHITIPKLELQAAVYGVRLSRYSANTMSELTKSFIGPTYQQFYSGYKQRTRNNKCSLRTEQRKYWKIIDGSMTTRQRCPHRNPRNVYRRSQGVRMAKRAGMATTQRS